MLGGISIPRVPPTETAAQGKPLVVAPFDHLRHGHKPDGGCRCRARPADGCKPGAGGNAADGQSPRQPTQPVLGRRVHVVPHSGKGDNFGHQDEKRKGDQKEVRARVRRHLGDLVKHTRLQKGQDAGYADEPQAEGNAQPKPQQEDQNTQQNDSQHSSAHGNGSF